MGKRFTYLISLVLLVSLGSCATYSSVPSATSSGPRTLVLDNDSISEDSHRGTVRTIQMVGLYWWKWDSLVTPPLRITDLFFTMADIQAKPHNTSAKV